MPGLTHDSTKDTDQYVFQPPSPRGDAHGVAFPRGAWGLCAQARGAEEGRLGFCGVAGSGMNAPHRFSPLLVTDLDDGGREGAQVGADAGGPLRAHPGESVHPRCRAVGRLLARAREPIAKMADVFIDHARRSPQRGAAAATLRALASKRMMSWALGHDYKKNLFNCFSLGMYFPWWV